MPEKTIRAAFEDYKEQVLKYEQIDTTYQERVVYRAFLAGGSAVIGVISEILRERAISFDQLSTTDFHMALFQVMSEVELLAAFQDIEELGEKRPS